MKHLTRRIFLKGSLILTAAANPFLSLFGGEGQLGIGPRPEDSTGDDDIAGDDGFVLLSTSTPPPESLVYGRTVNSGDSISYQTIAQRDGGGDGIVEVDSEGVVTITPNAANDRFYGNFAIIFSFEGGPNEIKYVVHDGEAEMRTTHFTQHPRDAEGYTIIPTPDAVDSLIYYFDPDYVGGGTPKGYLLNDPEIAGLWQDPQGAIIPYSNVDLPRPFPLAREGKADYYLFKKGTTTTTTDWLIKHFNNGKSATQPHVVAYYGTAPERPIIDMDPRKVNSYTAFFNNAADAQYCHYYGLEVTSTYFNPEHPNFLGWEWNRVNDTAMKPVAINAGGSGAQGFLTGYLIEDCHFHHCKGVTSSRKQGKTDIHIRRNIFEWIYAFSGLSSGYYAGVASVLCEENLFYHCGWYRQRYSGRPSSSHWEGVATSGSTTTLRDVGAFAGEDLESVGVMDLDNGGYSHIQSNTDDELIFLAATNVDFAGGGNYKIGAEYFRGFDPAQGQGNQFNHNRYWGSTWNSLVSNNISIDPSSMHHKFTSVVEDADAQATGPAATYNIIIKNDLCVYGEIGHSIGGNTDYQTGYRFDDIRKHNCVLYRIGENQPSRRSLAWTGTSIDWDGGIIANNIAYHYRDNALVTNTKGMTFGQICQDVVMSRNVIYDIFPTNETAPNISRTFGNFGCTAGLKPNTEDATNCYVIGNYGINPSSGYPACALETDMYPGSAGVTWQDNHYYTTNTSSEFWNLQDTYANSTTWDALTGETGYTTTNITFNDPARTIETYMTSKGKAATIDALVTEAKAMMKPGSWNKEYTAKHIIAYIKEGFKEV